MFLGILQRLFGLASLALLVFAGYLIWSWAQWSRLSDHLVRILPPGALIDHASLHREDWRLWVAGALIALCVFGRWPMVLLLGRSGADSKRRLREPGWVLKTADGACLHVERDGPSAAPALIFVHGWALEGGMWWEAKRSLSLRYQVVTFDLAGLGKSTGPSDKRYSLERYADNLKEIVDQTGDGPVVLVGHSIGGMIVQTFCRRHPETLGVKVRGIVLENTSYKDPSQTSALGRLLYAVKPLMIAGMHLNIWLDPVFRLLNWQGYLSGSTHLAMRIGGFGTTPTRAQLEQVAFDVSRSAPAVQAKGNLAMFRWSVEDDLHDLAIPALVFMGGRDLVTRASAGDHIVALLPKAVGHSVDRAGHMGPVEFADEYNNIIERFADKVLARRPPGASRSNKSLPQQREPAFSQSGPQNT
jgi:pimeloyl-ACP methyl ester carboxylesterase